MPAPKSAGSVKGRVSVIMPCYNVADYVRSAIESVLSQTYSDVEVVAGDDGSTDNSRDILAELSQAHPGAIRTIQSAGNIGPFALRNLCIEEATGEFIAFLDADDLWHPQKLEQQIKQLEENRSAALSHTFATIIDDKGTPVRRLNLNSELYVGDCFSRMIRNNGVATSSVVVRREVLDKIGVFDERFRYRGDWEMWARVANHGEFALIPQELTLYRFHDNNISKNLEKIRPFAFAVLDKFEKEYGLSQAEVRKYVAPARAELLQSFGLTNIMNRNLRAARSDLLRALPSRPADPKIWAGLIKTFVYRSST